MKGRQNKPLINRRNEPSRIGMNANYCNGNTPPKQTATEWNFLDSKVKREAIEMPFVKQCMVLIEDKKIGAGC